jgi:D-alanyl-D-alanine-carboxypeptidase/D-alanyl-D-alanine-endopeptidase
MLRASPVDGAGSPVVAGKTVLPTGCRTERDVPWRAVVRSADRPGDVFSGCCGGRAQPGRRPVLDLDAGGYGKGLASDPLLSAPAPARLPNFVFDPRRGARHAAGTPYDVLLAERVLAPAGLRDTMLALRAGDRARLLQGHDFDGKPLPDVKTPLIAAGASGIYSTPSDVLRWLSWHLDRFALDQAEIRLLDHAVYLPRDGLDPVYGLDESGRMDAMGLGWIVMAPRGGRPLILQKAGGLQGMFSYAAFAPTRGVGVFAAINQFNVGAFTAMAGTANGLIEQLAPR